MEIIAIIIAEKVANTRKMLKKGNETRSRYSITACIPVIANRVVFQRIDS